MTSCRDSVVQATGVVPPDLAGAAKIGAYSYDPDKAKAMLPPSASATST